VQIDSALTKHNDAELPSEQRCVVKLHLEDEGVVNRIQLATNGESIDRIS
jgi:hypothetical protein